MLKRLSLPAALLALSCAAPTPTASQTAKPAPPPGEAINVRTLTRDKLFTSTPEQLGLKGADAGAKLWGVMIEVASPDGADAVTTMLSLRDGQARVTTSTTDGLAYGGYAAQEEAKKFVAEAERHLPRMRLTKEFPYPTAGKLRFYLLTRDGVYTAEAPFEEAGTPGHPLYPLAAAAHGVITKVQDAASKLPPPARP